MVFVTYWFYRSFLLPTRHLHLAIASGLEQVVWALIRAAPHPRLLDIQNFDDQSPLHLAVESRQHRIARWLIVAGARPCPRDLHGDSPLHIAARLNDHLSIQAIADPVKQQERDLLALGYQGHPYQTCDFDQWNYLGKYILLSYSCKNWKNT